MFWILIWNHCRLLLLLHLTTWLFSQLLKRSEFTGATHKLSLAYSCSVEERNLTAFTQTLQIHIWEVFLTPSSGLFNTYYSSNIISPDRATCTSFFSYTFCHQKFNGNDLIFRVSYSLTLVLTMVSFRIQHSAELPIVIAWSPVLYQSLKFT